VKIGALVVFGECNWSQNPNILDSLFPGLFPRKFDFLFLIEEVSRFE
jgi:hypothetical protein